MTQLPFVSLNCNFSRISRYLIAVRFSFTNCLSVCPQLLKKINECWSRFPGVWNLIPYIMEIGRYFGLIAIIFYIDCNICYPDSKKSLKCSVCGSKEKPLFSMPKNKDIKKKWEQNLQLNVLHSSKLRVCKIHFKKNVGEIPNWSWNYTQSLPSC